MRTKNCPNMNHGRSNPPIKFCPNCGETLNASLRVSCNEEKHRHLLKNRSHFCVDCGKKLLGK